MIQKEKDNKNEIIITTGKVLFLILFMYIVLYYFFESYINLLNKKFISVLKEEIKIHKKEFINEIKKGKYFNKKADKIIFYPEKYFNEKKIEQILNNTNDSCEDFFSNAVYLFYFKQKTGEIQIGKCYFIVDIDRPDRIYLKDITGKKYIKECLTYVNKEKIKKIKIFPKLNKNFLKNNDLVSDEKIIKQLKKFFGKNTEIVKKNKKNFIVKKKLKHIICQYQFDFNFWINNAGYIISTDNMSVKIYGSVKNLTDKKICKEYLKKHFKNNSFIYNEKLNF
jgi:hypothetical protein